MPDKKEHRVIGELGRILWTLHNEADAQENGRAKALTITKIEEAIMWADKIYNSPIDLSEKVASN